MVLGPTHEWCLLELCSAQSAQPAALGTISHSSYIDFLLPFSPTYCMFPNWLAFICSFNTPLLVTVSMSGPGVGTGVQWTEADINMTKASSHPPGATPRDGDQYGNKYIQYYMIRAMSERVTQSCRSTEKGGADLGKGFQRRRRWSWVLKAQWCVPGGGMKENAVLQRKQLHHTGPDELTWTAH